MYNKILMKDESSNKIKTGIDKLANAVKTTLGPRGKTVIINNPYGYPHVTKDGATVAASIKLEDQSENVGAMLIRDAAIKTAKDAGDGSTSATIYAQELFNYFNDNKVAPATLKEQLLKYTKLIVNEARKQSNECNDEALKEIATVSTNNDLELGNFVYEVYKNVGEDGSVFIKESNLNKLDVKYTKGIKFESGFMSTKFINNETRGIFETGESNVFVINDNIFGQKGLVDINKCLSNINSNDKSSLFVVKSIDEYALNSLIYNRVKNKMNICVVQIPGFGIAKDIYNKAIVESLINQELSEGRDKYMPIKCKRINVNLDSTTIELFPVERNSYIKDIQKKIENDIVNFDQNTLEDSTYDKDILIKIKAIYDANSADINVGGFTEGEVKEKIDRIDDALRAIKSAKEDGWFYGSGYSAFNVIHKVLEDNDLYSCKVFDGLVNAVIAPVMTMCENSGVDPSTVIEGVVENRSLFNFKTMLFEDVETTKIKEPVKVFTCALENAVNVAILLLSTNCIIEYDDKY